MSKVMFSGLFVAILTAHLVDAFALPFEGLYQLDIIHYNDFHARYEETSVETPTCRFNNGSCLGGFPRLYHEIMELKRQKPDSLVLNAGDSFQGTYWYTLLKWNITQEFMNLLPHDAHAVGNHEFDDGPEGLAPYFAALKAPVVAANMDVSKEPSLQGLFKPHIIVKRKGRKIGIIGLITTDTKTLSSPGNVVFTDPMEAADREVEILTEKGVDIIIILSHCGLEMDKEIARKHGKNVDIIVGGHSHSLLWNGPSPSGEDVAGPYPVFIETTDDKKHQVLIVQASAFTKYMGNLTVYFDYLGRYVKWEGGPVFLDRSIPEDLEIKQKLLPYAKLVHDAENVPIGESLSTLRFEDCVFGECALGDLLVDSTLDFAKAVVKSDLHHVSFIQRGNIKSSILNGQVTKGTIFDLLPFNDRIVTFELQGNHLREALERSVSEPWGTDPFKGPWLLQVSGLNVTYNITLPEGKRIVKVAIGEAGDDLNDDQYYQVTTPAYLSDGGDGFVVLIVQASAFTKYMGNLTVYFDYLGRYVKWEGGPVFLDRSIPEDVEIKQKLLPYAKLVHDAENVPIGESLSTLRFEDCVFGECALGDLLVDSTLDFVKAVVKSDLHHVSFIQRGNIKSSILNGQVTKGTIFDLLPFNDRIVTFELQGNHLREALERSVSEPWDTDPFKGPWLLQVSGLNVTYNITLPEGKRIVKVAIGEAGDDLSDDQYYQVTTPAYLSDGGDGFVMFKNGKKNTKVIGRDEKVLESYISKNSPLNISTDGRLEIVK